ncbi:MULTISPECIES: hypothetical protein [unclassified Rhodococcus (in: high G+C Gram-positive bacteria)]|uniref:hypothetical protein n=1 Tax=Rhodococcus sp. SJ-3 TaxID=3454628 RepID=UPI003F795A7D
MTTPDEGERPDEPTGDLSLGKLAMSSLGAAAAVLLVAALVIVLLKPEPVIGLMVALVGVVGAIAVMGIVSKRMTRKAFGPEKK